MPPDTRRSSSVTLIGVTLAATGLAASLALHLRLNTLQFDDTYIHLRIARNLMRTGRAYFNPGERVMATSSPLWTSLLSLLHVPSHPGWLAVMEAVFLWAACAAAAGVAWRTTAGMRNGTRWGITAAAVLLVGSITAYSSIGQMETPLAIAFLLGGWFCALREDDSRWLSTAMPLLALAACTRLELLPLLAAALTLQLMERKQYASCAVAVGIVLAACARNFYQFGRLLPNSMRAKQVTYNLSFRSAFQQFVAPRLSFEVAWLCLLLVTAAVAWSFLRGRASARRGEMFVVFSLLLSLQLMAAYVFRRTLMFPWYHPLVEVPLVMGLLLHRERRSSAVRPRWLMPLMQAALLLFFGAPYVASAGRFALAAVHPTVQARSRADDGDSVRVLSYLHVGQALRETCPSARLMTTEIGALGWSFEGHIDDAVGIATPEAIAYQPLRSHAYFGGIPVAYVQAKRPDVLVDYSILDTEMLLSGGLGGAYDLLSLPPAPQDQRGGALDAGWRGGSRLNVWLRRGGPCDSAAVREAVWHDFR